MAKIEHMSVAEVKRRFADVIGKVQHGDTRVVVERRGEPVVAIVPVKEAEAHAGQELLKVAGMAGEEGDRFYEMMRGVVAQRAERPPRPVYVPGDEDLAAGKESDQ